MQKRVISFHYTLTSGQGEVLDSSAGADPLTYLEGASQIIPGLERVLNLLSVGDKRKVEVAAKDAYGEIIPEAVVRIPRDRLPKGDIKVGDRFQAGTPQGSTVVTVKEVHDTEVVLDGNHPLAGQNLTFDIEITEMRAATADELSHGHAHGPGSGHNH